MTETATETVFVVIDLGCHECGVTSEPVGIYPTRDEADAAAAARNAETGCWRNGGQTFTGVFEMELPTDRAAQVAPSRVPSEES